MFNYKVGVFLAFIALLCAFNFVSAENKDLPLLSKVIYLDPGHGGTDSGAYYKGIKESDLNLQLSKRIMKSLKEDGATVYLTRYDDYDLALMFKQSQDVKYLIYVLLQRPNMTYQEEPI